ncbi:unnamed protein product [Peronospora destructor]|uniref:Uncharacterized protein n=1 Tax=Peronospora destructor TaxID=86335 RepID=A0AAV0VBZ2_9STRA|nr:unnamed protein product [Peronospora destructor]
MRELKMKKLKDLVQTKLTTLRQQRTCDAAAGYDLYATSTSFANGPIYSKLQTCVNELQTQLANVLAGSEARACEAYEKEGFALFVRVEFTAPITSMETQKGSALCSPTSSVSIFTDNGKSDSSCSEFPKSTDDWGEW